MRSDISLKIGNTVRYILDAKWKRIDEKSKDAKHAIVQSDMYQLFAYGTNYCDCTKVALIYPATTEFQKPLVPFKFQYGNLELLCLPFDVKDPKNSVSIAMNQLENE